MHGHRRWAVVVVVVTLVALAVPALVAAPAAEAAPAGTITVYGNSIVSPNGITTGPDGNVWVNALNAILRITPAGAVTTFAKPSPGDSGDITAGPDGNLWFGGGGNTIWRITTAGVITPFSSPDISWPMDLTAGPDGNVWFVNYNSSSVGRITPAGVVTKLTDAAVHGPTSITNGPDGNLWITNQPYPGSVSRITPAGAFTTFTAGFGAVPSPTGIVSGPGGALWFTSYLGTAIGRITTTGAVTTFPVGRETQGPLTVGADGNIWFSSDQAASRLTPAGAVAHFPYASTGFGPTAMTLGPDGRVWFSDNQTEEVGQVTTGGTVTRFADVRPDRGWGMARGPDGSMWFTSNGDNRIGRITDAGVTTLFSHPSISGPAGITAGPDGNLWFTNQQGSSIGRITPSGVVASFTSPDVSFPLDIVTGPDGNLWFTNSANDRIGRITPSGSLTSFGNPGIDFPRGITVGPDANLWFTSAQNRSVGRITTAGAVTMFPNTTATTSFPSGIVTGPDGNLWVTNHNFVDRGSISKVTTAGAITEYEDPAIGDPWEIEVGGDGNLWFTENFNHKVGRITPAGVVTVYGAGLGGPVGIAAGPDGDLWVAADARIARVASGGLGAPTSVVAVPGNTTAAVSWAAPSSDGGSPITGYTVTASPGGRTCTTTGALTCQVTGLTNGQPYTFTVRASTAVATGPPSIPSAAVTPRTVPGPPTAVSAAGGDGAVAVSWSPPASDGGAAVTGYAVTASPGGATCSPVAGLTTCVVSGLTNGQPYTFTVRATNAAGTGAPSGPAGATPQSPGSGPRFHPLPPARILDTRPGPEQTGLAGRFTAGQARQLQVAGRGGVPTGATGVVVNVTAVLPSAGSFLSITPDLPAPGAPVTTSSLNLTPGQVRPNLVVAKLDAQGRLSIYNNSGTVDVLADVVGWFDDGSIAGDVLTSVVPTRILDTRPPPEQVGLAGAFGPGQARTLQVTGQGGVPVGATAVVMNVTSVAPSADSFLSLTPDALAPGQVPATSSLNLAAGQVRPNLVVVKLDAQGRVTIYNNSGTVHVLADVVGYFSAAGGGTVPTLAPTRILDTRPPPEQVGLAGRFGGPQARVLQVAGRGGVPAGAKAVWLNVTGVAPSADSFVSLVPDPLGPGQVPTTSNLNLAVGQVVPNLVLVKLDAGGRVTVFNNSGAVDLLADTVAYVP